MFSLTDGTNLALNRPATQISNYLTWEAGMAVDGIMVDSRSWTHWRYPEPWWKVQLAQPKWITHVEITNYKSNVNSMSREICIQGPFY